MNITVHWESSYTYASPVRMVQSEVRVLPRELDGQEVLDATLNVWPEMSVGERQDAYGNLVQFVGFMGDVSEIKLTAEASVVTSRTNEYRQVELSPLHRYLALQSTPRSPHDPRVAAIADRAGSPTDGVRFSLRLMDILADDFAFEVGRTDVEHTALDFIELGAGVCQDFAHLMLSALRMHDIPAFYVSGYLAPEEGHDEGIASHAWVQTYIDGQWHGFDPANNTRQDERYVTVAIGRDYDDVPPVRGSIRGESDESFSTRLKVHAERPQQ